MQNLSFDWQIDEYMINCRSRQLRPKTMNSYEQTLRLFERWCKEQLGIETVDKVTENVVRRYIADLQQRGKYSFYSNDKTKQINYPERRRDYRQAQIRHVYNQVCPSCSCTSVCNEKQIPDLSGQGFAF